MTIIDQLLSFYEGFILTKFLYSIKSFLTVLITKLLVNKLLLSVKIDFYLKISIYY